MATYNPNKQGWGFAAVVCIITAGLFFTAKTIHARTYLHPRNPMTEQVYHDRDSVKHEPAGAEHNAAGHPGAGAESAMPPAQSAATAAPQGDQLPPKKDDVKPVAPAKKH